MADNKTWGEYIFNTVAHNIEHVDILQEALDSVPDEMIGINREGLENLIKLLNRNTAVIQKFDSVIIDGDAPEETQ